MVYLLRSSQISLWYAHGPSSVQQIPLLPTASTARSWFVILHYVQAPSIPELCLHSQTAQQRWYGFLSSTSVYGDQKGAWTDERSVGKTFTNGVAFHVL